MSNENWGESRWEFTKSKSKWHFDPSTKSKDYQEVCTFEGEWHNEVFECLGRVEPSTWASRNKFDGKERIYSATQEENDLLENISLKKIFNKEISEYDLYLITAGYLGDDIKARQDPKEALKITISNYLGIIPWIQLITSDERISRFGRLWVFSSVAGDSGRPSNYHYGAAKSALNTYCEFARLL